MSELSWRKVFCPVDFSEESRAALRVAVDLARRFGAELTVFHAAAASSALQASAADPGILDDWKRQAERLGAAGVSSAVASGEPADAIVQGAQAGGYDLVVMGTHGRTGRDHALIGSVAENVVRRCRVPVLVVHADWPAATR
ncbi:MAG TPA: universal stress protein [Anaeromyxobacteraceae bacterium]|nr:universal stress protein [Anaeromyxobacteraceae bacterium]